MEKVKLFLEKLNADETLQDKMKELAADTAKANIDGIIALAKENGFDFSKEDMDAYSNSLTASGELSDEQLEQVAGGGIVGDMYNKLLDFIISDKFSDFIFSINDTVVGKTCS